MSAAALPLACTALLTLLAALSSTWLPGQPPAGAQAMMGGVHLSTFMLHHRPGGHRYPWAAAAGRSRATRDAAAAPPDKRMRLPSFTHLFRERLQQQERERQRAAAAESARKTTPPTKAWIQVVKCLLRSADDYNDCILRVASRPGGGVNL